MYTWAILSKMEASANDIDPFHRARTAQADLSQYFILDGQLYYPVLPCNLIAC